jgi:hypothetical protein
MACAKPQYCFMHVNLCTTCASRHCCAVQDTIGSAIGDVRQSLKDHTIIMIRSLGATDEDFPITDVVLTGSQITLRLAFVWMPH